MINGFVIVGQLNKETLQGPDTYVIMGRLKGAYTVEERDQWIRDIPVLIQELRQFGYIREETFDKLGYPVDTDEKGQEHKLTSNILTQHHRQRFTMPDNQHLSQLLLAVCYQVNQASTGS